MWRISRQLNPRNNLLPTQLLNFLIEEHIDEGFRHFGMAQFSYNVEVDKALICQPLGVIFDCLDIACNRVGIQTGLLQGHEGVAWVAGFSGPNMSKVPCIKTKGRKGDWCSPHRLLGYSEP